MLSKDDLAFYGEIIATAEKAFPRGISYLVRSFYGSAMTREDMGQLIEHVKQAIPEIEADDWYTFVERLAPPAAATKNV